MKASILYAYIALVGMASAQEACEEGKRVPISPVYTVEYRCNRFRMGQQLYENVLSHQDCATKCQVDGVDVCTYHAGRKMCRVGDPDGKEGPYSGATYMVRVPEEPVDPFPEPVDPFPEETCEGERDGLKTELDKCRADLEAASRKPPTCGITMWGGGNDSYKYFPNSMDRLKCKVACDAEDRCLSYSVHPTSPNSMCYLYDKEAANLPHYQLQGFAQYDKRCG